MSRQSPSEDPAFGKYLFNEGNTVFLGCGPTPFTYTAFFSAEAGFSNPTGVTTTPPSASPTTTPAPSARGDSSSGSGSDTSTTDIVIVAIGAVVALIGICVFIWFLYKVKRIRLEKNNSQWQDHTLSPSPSNPTRASKKADRLSKWSKIATIISSVFGLAGLVVAIYFGLKPKNS